jgi:hypothetical protein
MEKAETATSSICIRTSIIGMATLECHFYSFILQLAAMINPQTKLLMLCEVFLHWSTHVLSRLLKTNKRLLLRQTSVITLLCT